MISPRELAFLVVRDTFGSPPRNAQAAFNYRLRTLTFSERDRSFAAEIAYGSIKMRRLLDWWLKPYLGAKLATLPFSIAEILRMGVYQIRCMDGVPVHAAVHESVALAAKYGHRGTAGLVNAVLRKFETDAPPLPEVQHFTNMQEFLAVRYSFPTWILERFSADFHEEQLLEICRGLNKKPQQALRIDARRSSVAEVREALADQQLAAHASPFALYSLILEDAHQLPPEEARFVIQSESSAMPVDILDPQPGEHILELCAGRGNKTLDIAARLNGTGSLETIESDARKIQALQERLSAAELGQVNVVHADAVTVHGPLVDAALVDAPCSGLGILGRHPEARWRKAPDDATRLADLQLALLKSAAERVKPGGRLIYSVCSTDRCEGEAVIEVFLARATDFREGELPLRYASLKKADAVGQLLVPPGIEGRDGFFVAMLQRDA